MRKQEYSPRKVNDKPSLINSSVKALAGSETSKGPFDFDLQPTSGRLFDNLTAPLRSQRGWAQRSETWNADVESDRRRPHGWASVRIVLRRGHCGGHRSWSATSFSLNLAIPVSAAAMADDCQPHRPGFETEGTFSTARLNACRSR
jgi:hypothetical protein